MQSIWDHQITDFNDHELQSILALFLKKTELYNEHTLQKDKEEYFFYTFRRFAANYYHFENNIDASVYFMSVRKERAGEFNACGGRGRISNSSAKYFKTRHLVGEANRAKVIDEFSKKYQVTFNQKGIEDPRLFVGVKEIWKKLDHAEEIVAASEWADVISQSYCDEKLEAPIPKRICKHLIPFSIRNKVLQKHKNARMRKAIPPPRGVLEEEESEPHTSIPVINNTVAFERPAECDDEDWM
jgi:hypothetical protein